MYICYVSEATRSRFRGCQYQNLTIFSSIPCATKPQNHSTCPLLILQSLPPPLTKFLKETPTRVVQPGKTFQTCSRRQISRIGVYAYMYKCECVSHVHGCVHNVTGSGITRHIENFMQNLVSRIFDKYARVSRDGRTIKYVN